MAQNEMITGWIYKKGELTRKRINDWNLGIAIIISLILSAVITYPLIDKNYILLRGRIGGWMYVIVLIILVIVIYFLLKTFSAVIFNLYKMIFGVKDEEIIFTNYKISSTKKTWILNDDVNKLVSVKLDTSSKIAELNFKGTEQKPGKAEYGYNIVIPVPSEEMVNAEKICSYFDLNRKDTKAQS
ncbi:MAG: hypothetical protein ABJA78_07520 [Ferruginibacter sp.]